ncbi:CvpA family protein [bacterium]|jgi:membrane protein required for colicin V production|nr:CvpA family protein [bacterium]
MNFIDIGILIVITYNAVTGLRRGFARIIFNLIALFLGVTLGMTNYKFAAEYIHVFTGIEAPWVYYLGFAVVWGVVFIAVTLLGKFVEKVLKITFLGPLNTLGGFAFGIVKGVLILLPFLVPMIYFKTQPAEQSLLIQPFKPLIAFLLNNVINPEFFNPEKLLSSRLVEMMSVDILSVSPEAIETLKNDFLSVVVSFFKSKLRPF